MLGFVPNLLLAQSSFLWVISPLTSLAELSTFCENIKKLPIAFLLWFLLFYNGQAN